MTYAWADFSSALSNIRSWAFLAYKQIQFEHRRTFIGSLWIVLGFTIMAGGIGVLMGQLQGRPLQEHVPYVMFGFVGWMFISGMVTGGADVFYNARAYLLQMPLSRSVFALSLVLRQLYLMGAHLVAAVIVSLVMGWRPGLEALWVLPTLLIYIVAGLGVAMFLGLLAARVRDVSTLTASVMRLAFFFTPIIWAPGGSRESVGGFIGLLISWNPFSHFLYILRDGLLGEPQAAIHWIVSGAIAAGLLLLGFLALQVLGRRITYWL